MQLKYIKYAIKQMAEWENQDPPFPHKNIDSAIIHRQIVFVRNYLRGSCTLLKHETRFLEAGRETWDLLSQCPCPWC